MGNVDPLLIDESVAERNAQAMVFLPQESIAHSWHQLICSFGTITALPTIPPRSSWAIADSTWLSG